MHANADIDPPLPRWKRLLRAATSILGIVWALPLTLPGLLLAIPILICRGHLRFVRAGPAAIVSGPFADYLLAHHPFGAMCAMAIGHVIIAEQQGLTRQILTHELTHVRQAALWGALFPFAYMGASLWARLRGRDAYWHNVFEIAARKAERH
jgi:hypothetical protein